jgi:ferredoxin, 2Fe-2S
MQQRAPHAIAKPRHTDALAVRVGLVDGARFTVPARQGQRLTDLIRAYGLEIDADCHVRIADAWLDALPPADLTEQSKLTGFARSGRASRLASSLVMTDDLDGLELEVQPESLVAQTSWAAG